MGLTLLWLVDPRWRPACKAIQLHESMIDKALDRRPVFAESGAGEVCWSLLP